MKAIIIGAGRGSRLGHLTEEIPKTLVPVLGRPMLDHILEALASAGFAHKDIVFVCGYRAEVIRARYPDLTYVENASWESNNILLSLMCARKHMSEGFVASYADIVYKPQIARNITDDLHDIALGCDIDWLRRYTRRSDHPETDAEKMMSAAGRVLRLSRKIASDQATGEFIGVMKVAQPAVPAFLESFDQAARTYAGQIFREGRTFEKAYLLDYLQHLVELGRVMFAVQTRGGYMEIDTLQDRELAEAWWRGES